MSAPPSTTSPEVKSRSLTARLFQPVDIASLVFFRIAFGAIMLWEVWRFFHYDRIERYYIEPNLSAAHTILGQLSLSAEGISRRGLEAEFQKHLNDAGIALLPHEMKQSFNQLLRDLANDFYIEEVTEGQYDFASGVLKSWWKKYYA